MKTAPISASREAPDAILAKNLVVARLIAGITQKDLADAADISRATIAQLETGYSDPRLSTIVELANALGISPMLMLAGVAETAALAGLSDRIESDHLEISAADLERMRQHVQSGMLKDRLRAARLGAQVVAKSDPAAAVTAAVMSAILPGAGTVVGAASAPCWPRRKIVPPPPLLSRARNPDRSRLPRFGFEIIQRLLEPFFQIVAEFLFLHQSGLQILR